MTIRPGATTVSELDNPVWSAAAGPQRDLGTVTPLAARFDPDVSPFGGFPARPPKSTGGPWPACSVGEGRWPSPESSVRLRRVGGCSWICRVSRWSASVSVRPPASCRQTNRRRTSRYRSVRTTSPTCSLWPPRPDQGRSSPAPSSSAATSEFVGRAGWWPWPVSACSRWVRRAQRRGHRSRLPRPGPRRAPGPDGGLVRGGPRGRPLPPRRH